MAQSNMTEATTYIYIGFIIALVIFFISSMATIISNSEHAELTSASEDKMEELSLNPDKLGFAVENDTEKTSIGGFELDVYDDNIGNAIDPDVADNKNEFSLDFTFGLKKANALTRFIIAVISFPKFLVYTIFGLPEQDMFKVIVDLTTWLWRILIFVAIVYWVRNK